MLTHMNPERHLEPTAVPRPFRRPCISRAALSTLANLFIAGAGRAQIGFLGSAEAAPVIVQVGLEPLPAG